MLSLIWQKQKEPKYLAMFGVFWLFMYGLYTFLDILFHGSFAAMVETLGGGLLVIHQLFNVVIALVVATMLSFSQIQLNLTKSEPTGGNAIPFFSFVFGLFTFGCAPCVVTFLGVFGIAFTPLILPFGNLLWKIVLLAIMGLGAVWVLYRIQNTTCTVKNR